MGTRIEIRVKALDHRLADEAARQLVGLARTFGACVQGPVPLPVVRGKLEPEENPALLQSERVRGLLFKRVLQVSELSDDAVLAFSNMILPAGVRSQVRMLQA